MGDLILYLCMAAVGYGLGSRIRNHKERFGWTGKMQLIALIVLILLMGMRMGSNPEVTENLHTIGLSSLFITVIVMVFSVGGIFLARLAMKIDRYGRLQGSPEMTARNTGTPDSSGTADSFAPDPSDTAGSFGTAGSFAPDSSDTACSFGTADPSGTEKKLSEKADHQSGEAEHRFEKAEHLSCEEEKNGGSSSTTAAIVISVAVGMALGYFVIRRVFSENPADFDAAAGLGIKIGLCILLLFVGLDLGIDGTVIDNFRKVGLRILIFPAVVITGTLAASALCSLVMDFSLKECVAIGAGFGWYSMAPGILMEAGFVAASAVSFLHNVMRELFSIVLIPVVAKKIGYIETTGMPGAAAMDVCLPIVEKSTRSDIAVYSFVSGVILSAAVPILVPFIVEL